MKNMSLMSSLSVLAILLLTAGFFQMQGCGGGGGGGVVSGIDSTTSTGTLKVAITDSPAFRDFSSVHIRINRIAVVPAGKENLPDNDPGLPVIADFTATGGQDVNILKLHFLQQLLGTAVLPAGKYNQVRLILASNPNKAPFNNYFVLAGASQQIALTTPSARESGVKILGRFTVTAGILNTILLEFNPDAAIVKAGSSGQNNLKPTGIRIQQIYSALNEATGSISGTIRSPGFSTWSSATISIAPRNPAAPAIVAGDVFSNFSSPGVWKAPFIAYVPPNGSAQMPSTSYKVFVSVLNPGSKFRVYSSTSLTVTSNSDTGNPVNLTPVP